MVKALAERVPMGGSVIAPEFEGPTIETDTPEQVGAPRFPVPSRREQGLGEEARYEAAPEEKPPPGPPIWAQVKQFIKEADPREITRECPRFPLYWTAVVTALATFNLTSTLGPEIQQDVGISLATQVAIGQAVALVTRLLSPYIGYLVDHVKRVFLLRGAYVVQIVGAFIQPFAPNPTTYFAGGIIGAAGDIVGIPAYGPLMADYYPVRTRTRQIAFLGLVGAGFGLVGPIVGGSVGQVLGWRMALLVTNIVGAIVAAGVFFLKEPIRGYQDRKAMGVNEASAVKAQPPMSFGESWRASYAIRTLRRGWYAIPFIAIAGQSGLLQSYYFQSFFHLSPSARGLVAAISTIPTIPAFLLGGVLGDRMLRANRPGRILIYGQVISIVSTLLIVPQVFLHSLPLSIALGFAFVLPTTIFAISTSVLGTLIVPARFRATGNTASLPFDLIGLFLGPIALNYALANLGLKTGILVLVPFGIIGSAILISQAFTVEGDIRRSLASSLAQEDLDRFEGEGKRKLLVCRDVEVEYGGTQVVFGVDFDVDDGEIVALLGTNGSGKSTMLKAIAGINPATGGAIYFDGVDITHQPPHEQAAKGVCMVPGGRAIFPSLTVRENLRCAAWLYRKDNDYVQARTQEMLDLFPVLRERYDEQAGNMSGGEQQQLCLAQAFLMRPRLLMVDELTLGLAPQVVERLLAVIRKINADGTTVILVEQSINLALTIAPRAVFMEKGEVMFDGPTVDLLERGDIARSVFLGGSRQSQSLGSTRTRSALQVLAEEEETYDKLLQVSGLKVEFGGVAALQGVEFDMDPHEILGIIGPNGAGKTTVFDVISGFVTPPDLVEGQVILAGRAVTAMSPDRRHYVGLCRSFQNVRLFSGMTARETIAVAFERHLQTRSPVFAALWLPNHRTSERKTFKKVDALIDTLGLGAFANKFMDELSTGSRRLVEIACLLASGPKLLLLDEPSSGLAQAENEELGPVIARIRQETGCGVLIIEHDLPLIASLSDRLLAMELGTVITSGKPEDVIKDPRVVESYLGVSEEVIMRSGALSKESTRRLASTGGQPPPTLPNPKEK